MPLTESCGHWDLRVLCGVWPAWSVVGVGDRVTTEDQIDWRIIFVHDAFDKDHARMRSIEYLLQFVAGCYGVGLCLLVATEDIRQFRVFGSAFSIFSHFRQS